MGCILYLLLYKKTPFAHIKNIYAKMQAIIDPNKQIDYPTLPNYYPIMLIEVNITISKLLLPDTQNNCIIDLFILDGSTVSQT